jgi:hypothetical protein
MPTRNPASVLPDPVGAAISVSCPAAMRCQPACWAGVGPSGNRRSNQAATAGWNPSAGRVGPSGRAGNRVSGSTLDSRVGGERVLGLRVVVMGWNRE